LDRPIYALKRAFWPSRPLANSGAPLALKRRSRHTTGQGLSPENIPLNPEKQARKQLWERRASHGLGPVSDAFGNQRALRRVKLSDQPANFLHKRKSPAIEEPAKE